MRYQLKKVFKLSEMPKEIWVRYDYNITEAVFETVIYPILPSNSSEWNVENYNERNRLIDFLIENGAELNEEVIIDLYS